MVTAWLGLLLASLGATQPQAEAPAISIRRLASPLLSPTNPLSGPAWNNAVITGLSLSNLPALQAPPIAARAIPATPQLADSKALGRDIGRLIAAERSEANSPLPTLAAYLQSRLDDPALPPKFQEQLRWVRAHPDLFEKLYDGGILPLDMSNIRGDWLTVVEHFQNETVGRYPAINHEQMRQALGPEIEYHLVNPFGAKGSRGHDYIPSALARSRPELVGLYRPSRKEALFKQAREAKRRDKKVSSDEPRRFSVHSDGTILNLSLKQLPAVPARTFWRLSWRSFETPRAAIDYLLSGGEAAPITRDDGRHTPLERIARKLLVEHPLSLRERARGTTLGNFNPDKFFVSVSGRPLKSIGESTGNLRVEIASDRAFKVGGFQDEDEYGLPLIINPIEISAAELRLKNGTVRMVFHWVPNHRSVRVEIDDGQKTRFLQYDYDPARKFYVLFDESLRHSP